MTLGIEGRFVVPDVVSSHFHIREGDVVADFGAGGGYFVKTLSKLVGSEGKVYALEIQRQLVDAISDLARKNGLSNVEPLWCDIEEAGGCKIHDNVVDCGVLVNTLFQMEDKAIALCEISRTIRPGAKLFVIDWSESFGGLGPQPNQVLTKDDAKACVETAGFIFEREFDAGDHHYGLGFRKP